MAYANTDHLFSQPVRYYKANDPYYYEVDNIPIRQLEENVLWVKDQIDSLISPASGEPVTGSPLFVGDDIDLEYIKQLRPKVVGGRYVSVNAGRFNARVNDAYNVKDSLAQLIASFGLQTTCANAPSLTQNDTAAFFDSIWESYTKKLTSATFTSCPGESLTAGGMRSNGLETMYTFYMSNDFGYPISGKSVTSYGAPEYESTLGQGKTWPALWHLDISNFFGQNGTIGLNTNHIKITQHWRGVVRTAVADFRGETIEIAPFSEYDYWYAEEVNGSEVVTSLDDLASQRIDLLVVYTQPIDASGATLSEYDGVNPIPLASQAVGTPKKITTPRLGIIRGAGIGIKRTPTGGIDLLDKRIVPGEQKILANLNDHTDGGSNTGIKLRNGTIVHGSFPSPDDLVNIAPNLTLGLADNDLQLIGQTALPIAYIVVDRDTDNLSQDNVIDIRPFFRTTELAYNERAGIAAAQPAISFANPVVGQAEIVKVTNCLEGMMDAKIAAGVLAITPPNTLHPLSYAEVTEPTEDIIFTSMFDDSKYSSYELHSTIMIGENDRMFPSWGDIAGYPSWVWTVYGGNSNFNWTHEGSWMNSYPYFLAANFSKDNGANWDTNAVYHTMLGGADGGYKGNGWDQKNMAGLTPLLSEGKHSCVSQIYTLSGGPALISTTGAAQCKTVRDYIDQKEDHAPCFRAWLPDHWLSPNTMSFDKNGSYTGYDTKVWIAEDSDYLSETNYLGGLKLSLGVRKFRSTIFEAHPGGSRQIPGVHPAIYAALNPAHIGQRPTFKPGSKFTLYGRLKF